MDKESSLNNTGSKPERKLMLQQRLYSVEHAAIYLGTTAWGVREMYYDEKIPCVRNGRRVFLDVKDMDAWIERNKTQIALN
jgi:excisionase family DNA binding protein